MRSGENEFHFSVFSPNNQQLHNESVIVLFGKNVDNEDTFVVRQRRAAARELQLNGPQGLGFVRFYLRLSTILNLLAG